MSFQPDPGSLLGRNGRFLMSHSPVFPSPPVAGAWHRGATAEGPGRAAHAQEAAGFAGTAGPGALWAMPCHREL